MWFALYVYWAVLVYNLPFTKHLLGFHKKVGFTYESNELSKIFYNLEHLL